MTSYSVALKQNERFSGTLSLCNPATVAGEIHGHILSLSEVIIAPSARIYGLIIASKLVILGQCEGTIVATESLAIYGPADVKGAIYSPILSMDDEAKLNCSCCIDPHTPISRSILPFTS